MVCLHLGVGLGFPAKHCPEWLFQIMQVPNLSALTPKHCRVPQMCPAVLPTCFPSSEPQAEVGALQSGQHQGVPGCILPLRGKLAELGGKMCPEKEHAFFLLWTQESCGFVSSA